jgi:ribosomal-protein-alanine N-acetyltransferase
MDIRPYQAKDLDTLYEIDQECFPPGISYSKSELARFIGHRLSKTWVAFSDHGNIGFVILEREPHEVGHIVTIDVTKDARAAGVGSALMKVVEDWANRQSLRLIYLETAADNRTAQIFYKGRGYVKVEEIADYYSTGHPAWVMVKWL